MRSPLLLLRVLALAVASSLLLSSCGALSNPVGTATGLTKAAAYRAAGMADSVIHAATGAGGYSTSDAIRNANRAAAAAGSRSGGGASLP